MINIKGFIPSICEDHCFLICSFSSWRDRRLYSMPKYTQPLSTGVSSTILHIFLVTVMSNTLHRSSFKNTQIYIAKVHKQVKMLLINTRHHFRKREFIPRAAAAAASFAFFSSSFFFAASSLCFLIMARRARSALAWSVFPAKCIFM